MRRRWCECPGVTIQYNDHFVVCVCLLVRPGARAFIAKSGASPLRLTTIPSAPHRAWRRRSPRIRCCGPWSDLPYPTASQLLACSSTRLSRLRAGWLGGRSHGYGPHACRRVADPDAANPRRALSGARVTLIIIINDASHRASLPCCAVLLVRT